MSLANFIVRFLKSVKALALIGKITIYSYVNYFLYPRPSCTNSTSLDGKTVVITGGDSGMGFEIAKKLYKQGARVILANLNEKLTHDAAERIRNDSSEVETEVGEIVVTHLNLCSLKSVMKCAQNLLATEKNIHFLINNAGATFPTKIITEDGLESSFAIYLGHFLFTMLLLPKLMTNSGPQSRVINTTSIVFKTTTRKQFDVNYENERFNTYDAYSQCKLATVLFTEELARKLKGKGVSVYSVHPGIVNTPLSRAYSNNELIKKFIGIVNSTMSLTPSEGAASILRIIFKTDDADSGAFYDEYGPSKSLNDEKMAQKLWELSWSLVKGKCNLQEYEKELNL